MKRSNVRSLIALAALLAVYHAAAFLIPFHKTAVFWISYVFTLISFGVAVAAVWIGLGAKKDVRSKFYGFPIARIGVAYWLFQVAAGLLLSALEQWVPWWLAALIAVAALGAAAVGMVSADAVVEEITRQDVKLKADVRAMRALQSQVNALPSQCADLDAAAALRRFAEELKYSDPVTGGTEETEAELSSVVDELQRAVTDGDAASVKQLCRRASGILAERNRLCKLNKGQN